MSDLWLAIAWVAVLGAGLGVCFVLHERGVPSTHVRDLLHVGTGIWVLGWPLWSGLFAPIAIVGAVTLATASVPALARRHPALERLTRTFASGDERWSGLVLYTAAYAVMTVMAFSIGPFAAAAALLALSLGDGIGGAVGLKLGRHHFSAPGGKQKSFEGSLAVAVAAALGVLVAAWRFDVTLGAGSVAGLGAVAALGEALAPRGTDNAFVPAVVWSVAELLTG